jgi:hypothetical protein
MPSRPVLIGRGLVPTPYKTHHSIDDDRTRPLGSSQTTTPPSGGMAVRELNTYHQKLGTPPHQISGCVCSARVTAAIAKGKHPVPYRTRKLSLSAPMVLQPRGCGRVGRRRTYIVEEGSPLGGPSSAFLHFCVPGFGDGIGSGPQVVHRAGRSCLVHRHTTPTGRVVGSNGEGSCVEVMCNVCTDSSGTSEQRASSRSAEC